MPHESVGHKFEPPDSPWSRSPGMYPSRALGRFYRRIRVPYIGVPEFCVCEPLRLLRAILLRSRAAFGEPRFSPCFRFADQSAFQVGAGERLHTNCAALLPSHAPFWETRSSPCFLFADHSVFRVGAGERLSTPRCPSPPPTPHSGKHISLRTFVLWIIVLSGRAREGPFSERPPLDRTPLVTSGRRRQRWPALPIRGRPRSPSGRRSRRIPVRRRPW